ncbi:MAG: ATP-binding protein [Pseudomonadota bacterium]
MAGSAALAVLLAGAAVGCGAVLLRRGTAAPGLAGRRAAARAFETLRARIDEPRVLCDGLGRLIAANRAFRNVAGSVAEDGWLERSLQADPDAGGPDAASEVYRLARAARRGGAARSDRLRLDGDPTSVRVEACGDDLFEWRFERSEPRDGASLAAALDLLGVPAIAEAAEVAPSPNLAAAAAAPDLATRLAAGRPLDAALAGEPVFAARLATPGEARSVRILAERPAHSGEAEAFTKSLARLPVPLARISGHGRLISLNAPARRLLGPEAVPGAALTDLLEGLGRSMTERIVEASRGIGSGRAEMARALREDREAFLQLSLTQVQIDGEATLLAVMNDATELKTLEAQFVQSQKMQAVGQLAGGIAHDFNNLLTAILGHCDLLLMRHDSSQEDHSDLVQLRQNANRAAALVRQMLAFSRKQTLRPVVLDLGETLRDLSHLLNRLIGEKVRLEISVPDDLGRIRADHRQLEQVIVNLVVNARDAMPGGGAIRISAVNETLGVERRRDRAVMPAGDYVTIQVADEGSGIPPDRLGQIFEPFFTTKKVGEGTGLGLSTAYGIVKQTGGFIFADSPVARGAVFSIHLPRHVEREEALAQLGPARSSTSARDLDAPDASLERSAPRPEAPSAAASSADGDAPAGPPPRGEAKPSGSVLLVEDEAPVRSFASRALALRGWSVLEADCAETALAMLEDPELQVDVVVSDVVMPGLDGPSWVRMARRSRPDLSVVFVSGYAEDVFRRHIGDLGDYRFLPKPYLLTDLSEAIETACGDRAVAEAT